MIRRATTALAAAFLLLAPAISHADLATYNQDFESLVQADPNALSSDGWLVFVNIFSPDHSTYYGGYGFPAQNNTGRGSGIDFTLEVGPQGAQDLVVYSDYGADQSIPNQFETNVYQERMVGAADVGSTWSFQFDAKHGNLVAPSTALAFIKTLNPSAGYAMTNFITMDMTGIPATWSSHSISITIDASLVGQILQFGFANTTWSYTPSGIFYDNVSFRHDTATPATRTTWGSLKSLYR